MEKDVEVTDQRKHVDNDETKKMERAIISAVVLDGEVSKCVDILQGVAQG